MSEPSRQTGEFVQQRSAQAPLAAGPSFLDSGRLWALRLHDKPAHPTASIPAKAVILGDQTLTPNAKLLPKLVLQYSFSSGGYFYLVRFKERGVGEVSKTHVGSSLVHKWKTTLKTIFPFFFFFFLVFTTPATYYPGHRKFHMSFGFSFLFLPVILKFYSRCILLQNTSN